MRYRRRDCAITAENGEKLFYKKFFKSERIFS